MDTPADPATPLKEVYQAFFDDLDKEGTSDGAVDSSLIRTRITSHKTRSKRQRSVRKQAVAGGDIEYFPGAWGQTWSVTLHAKTGGWTVFDIRESNDGGGDLSEDFLDLDSAVRFVAGEIESHDGHFMGRPVTRPRPARSRRVAALRGPPSPVAAAGALSEGQHPRSTLHRVSAA